MHADSAWGYRRRKINFLTPAMPLFTRKRRLKRGSFRSLVDLQAAINRYLDEANADPKPFV